METFGAKGEDRSLTPAGLEAQAARVEDLDQRFSNPLAFPILYLVGETDALNPANWGHFDLSNLRPLSMVAWVFLGLPFFLAGLAMILRKRPKPRASMSRVPRDLRDNAEGEGSIRWQTTPSLLVLLAFIGTYAAVGWLSGTTTRYTLPAIPPMVGIAGFAWTRLKNDARMALVAVFDVALLSFIFIYYLVLK
jgi:hypothetical protein